MGGKARIARRLASVMLPAAGHRHAYLEPFVGGGWIFAQMAPAFRWAAAGDAQPDIVKLWQAAADGWVPPMQLSREEYRAQRHAEPSALRAFAGFGCSFGGKWFGGYGDNARGDDFVGAAHRAVLAKAEVFRPALIRHTDYAAWRWPTGLRPLIYCDPPYAGTTAYEGTPAWDPERFWATAEGWAASGAQVFVSEYDAPPGWSCVWRATVKVSLAAHTNTATAEERLFTKGIS